MKIYCDDVCIKRKTCKQKGLYRLCGVYKNSPCIYREDDKCIGKYCINKSTKNCRNAQSGYNCVRCGEKIGGIGICYYCQEESGKIGRVKAI